MRWAVAYVLMGVATEVFSYLLVVHKYSWAYAAQRYDKEKAAVITIRVVTWPLAFFFL